MESFPPWAVETAALHPSLLVCACAGIDGLSGRRASAAGRGEGWVRVLASGVEYTDAVSRFHLYAQTMLC